MFTDALTYPIRSGGWIMIVLGAILGVVFDIGSIAPVLGFAVFVFGGGYFCAFYFDIVGSTMCGHDDVPDWPGFSDIVDEIVSPLLKVIGLVLISFGPAIAVLIYNGSAEPEVLSGAPFVAAIAFGVFYFPMAIIANQAFGTFTSVLPHVVVPAIFKALPGYLIAVVALAAVYAVAALAQTYAVRVPIAGWFFSWAVSLYGLMFQARLIGLIYRARQEVLDFP